MVSTICSAKSPFAVSGAAPGKPLCAAAVTEAIARIKYKRIVVAMVSKEGFRMSDFGSLESAASLATFTESPEIRHPKSEILLLLQFKLRGREFAYSRNGRPGLHRRVGSQSAVAARAGRPDLRRRSEPSSPLVADTSGSGRSRSHRDRQDRGYGPPQALGRRW